MMGTTQVMRSVLLSMSSDIKHEPTMRNEDVKNSKLLKLERKRRKEERERKRNLEKKKP